MKDKNTGAEQPAGADAAYRQMTANDLAVWGVEFVAYIKPVEVEGQEAFAIHAANGTQIGVAVDRDVAFAMVRQNDLEPVSVH